MAGVNGKLVFIKIEGKELACQTSLSLDFTTNTNVDPVCKPQEGESSADSSWVTRSEDSREWTATADGQLLATDLSTLNDVSDLIGLFVNGSVNVTVGIETNSTSADYTAGETIIFTGDAIMNGLSITADGDSIATGSVTFESNGKPTYVKSTVIP